MHQSDSWQWLWGGGAGASSRAGRNAYHITLGQDVFSGTAERQFA